MPAFTASSLYCCIAANASGFGGGPASDSFVAMPMTMKRIVLSWIRFGTVAAAFAASPTRRTRPVKIDTSFEKAVNWWVQGANVIGGRNDEGSRGAECLSLWKAPRAVGSAKHYPNEGRNPDDQPQGLPEASLRTPNAHRVNDRKR